MGFDLQDNWGDVPSYRKQGVRWAQVNPNAANIVYAADVDCERWLIRLNDFPEEPLYTLIVAGKEVIHFNEWPAWWDK